MGVKLVYGNLLKTKDVDVIVHHVNCLSIRAHGLSEQIAEHFPWADKYSTRRGESSRKLAVLEDRRIPGKIKAFKSRHQTYRQVPPYKDTKENRLHVHWFRQCLDELATVNIKSVGIPHNVGCGLGADWADYIKIKYVKEKLGEIEPMIMNEATEKQFQNATHCYVCYRQFTENLIKVRDHDHLGMNGDPQSTDYSNYRGAACNRCNLNLQRPSFIPVYFHNLKL